MMTWIGTSRLRRALAGVVLVGVLSAFVPLAMAGGTPQAIDCRDHHVLAITSSVGVTPGHDGCHGHPLDLCRAMPGCGFATPALAAGRGGVPPALAPTAARPREAPAIRGVLAHGPPPPPPNS